jgi:hypothetical protein
VPLAKVAGYECVHSRMRILPCTKEILAHSRTGKHWETHGGATHNPRSMKTKRASCILQGTENGLLVAFGPLFPVSLGACPLLTKPEQHRAQLQMALTLHRSKAGVRKWKTRVIPTAAQ